MTEQTSKELPTRLSALAEQVHDLIDGRLDEALTPGQRRAWQAQRLKRYDDEEALQKHAEERRAVWLSRGGLISAPKQTGGRAVGQTDRVTVCKTRYERVEVHLFDASKANAEALLDTFIAAICRCLNVVEFSGYDWPTQEPDNAGSALRNQCVVLRFVLPMPVPSELSELHTFDEVEDECGILREDGKIAPSDGSAPYDP